MAPCNVPINKDFLILLVLLICSSVVGMFIYLEFELYRK